MFLKKDGGKHNATKPFKTGATPKQAKASFNILHSHTLHNYTKACNYFKQHSSQTYVHVCYPAFLVDSWVVSSHKPCSRDHHCCTDTKSGHNIFKHAILARVREDFHMKMKNLPTQPEWTGHLHNSKVGRGRLSREAERTSNRKPCNNSVQAFPDS